jgi:hypothetical protein
MCCCNLDLDSVASGWNVPVNIAAHNVLKREILASRYSSHNVNLFQVARIEVEEFLVRYPSVRVVMFLP